MEEGLWCESAPEAEPAGAGEVCAAPAEAPVSRSTAAEEYDPVPADVQQVQGQVMREIGWAEGSAAVTARPAGAAALSDDALLARVETLHEQMATVREHRQRAHVREEYEAAETEAYRRGLWQPPATFDAELGVRRQALGLDGAWRTTGTGGADGFAAQGSPFLPARPEHAWSPADRSPAALHALEEQTVTSSLMGVTRRYDPYVRAGRGADPRAARGLVESYLSTGPGFGDGRRRLAREVGLGAAVDPTSAGGAAAVHEQLALANEDAGAFRGRLRRAAFYTAEDLIGDSEKAIRSQLARYGIRDLPEGALADGYIGKVMSGVTIAQNQDAARPMAEREREDAEREKLAMASRELVRIQADIQALLEARQERLLVQGSFDPNRIFAGRAERSPVADLEAFPSVDREGTPAPEGATVTQLEALLADKRRVLKLRWLELEKEAPMLAAFRDRGGAPSENLEILTEAGDDQQAALIAQVVPKLRNIARVRAKLDAGELEPLALPQVVAMTRQRLGVPPGSMRDSVLREEVADAKSGDTNWAITALTLGLAVLTAVPSGGSSLIAGVKVAAELVMLGADLWQGAESIDAYQTAKAATDTDLDQAKSLSDEDPSLAWLAIDLLAIPLDLGSVRTSYAEARAVMRKARALRVATEAGQEARALREELNRLGKRQGLPDGAALGDRVEREALGARTGGRVAAAEDAADGMLPELATRLGVPVEAAPIGSAVQVDLHIAGGEVEVARVRVGPAASATDVLLHKETIRLAQRYNGRAGGVRKTLDQVKGLFGQGALDPGSPQWRAWLEGEKHLTLSAARLEALAVTDGIGARALLSREIADLDARAQAYDELAATLHGPAAEAAVVGKPNLEHWSKHFGFSDDLIAEGTFAHGTGAWAATGARAPHVPAELGGEVARIREMTDLEAGALGEQWIERLKSPQRRVADPVKLRVQIADAANQAADQAIARLQRNPAFRQLPAAERAKLVEHLRHHATQAYFDKVEDGVRGYMEVLAGHHGADDELLLAGLVDEAVAVRPIGGRLPINHDFAGRYKPLDQLSPDVREVVEAKGLPGIAYPRNGQPDFTPFVHEHEGVRCEADIGKLTGDRDRDFAAALSDLRARHPELGDWRPEPGLTWHHHEGGKLILVPTPIHEEARHTGPVSMFKAESGDASVYGGET